MSDRTHLHVTGNIQAWLGGELTAEAAARLEAHRKICPACAAACAEARLLWEQLEEVKEAVPAPQTSVWPAVRRRTLGRPEAAPWFFGTGRLVRSSLATAAVCAGLLLGILAPGGATNQVGGTAGALTTTEGQSEMAWLSGTSWDSGLTDFETAWLAADLAADASSEPASASGTATSERNP